LKETNFKEFVVKIVKLGNNILVNEMGIKKLIIGLSNLPTAGKKSVIGSS